MTLKLKKKIITAINMIRKDRNQLPYAIFRNLSHQGFLNFLSDDKYLKIMYRLSTGEKLDLDNPKTFNEKLQWLKLYDRKDLYTLLVDKYRVRQLVSRTLGDEYLIPLLGVWENANDIDFNSLPKQFVLKCNHDSGSVILIKDKSNIQKEKIIKTLNKALKTSGYWFGREWPYKNVKPCIIAEQLMVERDYSSFAKENSIENEGGIKDYKFYCFNGEPLFCQLIADRLTIETIDFYDLSWKLMDFTGNQIPSRPHSNKKYKKPENYELMIRFAQKLSLGIPFSRIDFYDINNHLYFGEITLYPASGFGRFEPDQWNRILGDKIILPK